MKTLLLILLPLNLLAQTFGQLALSATQFAVSGGCDAILQADHFYPTKVTKAFPGYELAKDTYGRKYKNGDPAQGEAFLGSTTVFAGVTDPFHRVQTLRNITMVTGAVTWAWKSERNWYEWKRDYKKKPLWAYGFEALVNYAAYNVGKEITFQYIKSK